MRWLKEAKGAPRGLKMDLVGATVLPWPRGFHIGATLDASMTLKKSGGLRGHLKVA